MFGDLSALAGKAWQWTKDHAAEIGDLLNKISGVLGVIALATVAFEPVGAIWRWKCSIRSTGNRP